MCTNYYSLIININTFNIVVFIEITFIDTKLLFL